MKKLLFATGLLLAAGSASAQDNVVKVNIFSPLVKTGSFFFEHKISPSSSLQLGGLFTSWNIGDTDITGFAITPEYRFYLSSSKEAVEGFYVGPFARYQNLSLKATYEGFDNNGNVTEETAEASLNTFGGGVVVGHQWIFKQRFSLDTFLGPSYNGGSLTVKDGADSETFDAGAFQGFGIRTGVTFGIAF
jgi:hypothetical protein